MNKASVTHFQQTVRNYYTDYGRHDMLWRQPDQDGKFDPYKIMVSEIMLQQTQVSRVTVKYQEFLELFPNIKSLAVAPLAEVLSAWSGLGYNRRAKFLWQAAQTIQTEFSGVFPTTLEALVTLPGIGPNTAGAILAYAFNTPVIFIETNIRTVFIHHFFNDKTNIQDSAIKELAAGALDTKNPREWYWALMDYGAYLKATEGNLGRLSKSYARQSMFKGSLRQIRGQVLKLLKEGSLTMQQISESIGDARLANVLTSLKSEQLISLKNDRYHLG